MIVVVARTSTGPGDRRGGLTLLVVEDGMPGFTRGRKLEKLGLRGAGHRRAVLRRRARPGRQPAGEEGEAFGYLGRNLPQERLAIAVGSVSRPRRRSR